MTKYQVVIITLLTVLVFIVGCPPAERKPVDSTEAEIPKFEPAETEPNLFEPDKVEPDEAEPIKTEPNEVEPIEIEPNDIEPPKVEPNEAEPIQAEPNEVVSSKAEPNEVKQPPKMIFHDKCAGILSSFVDDEGMVDYRKLKLKRLKLRQLLDEFADLNPKEYNSWTKEDKIAFWINAYNIQLLRIIIENYPIEPYRLLTLLPGWEPDSIRHINKRIDKIKKQKFIVLDEEFTLLRVEQRFFRKEFDEPRAFFALSHATLSSPPLRNEPYYGHKLSHQLDDQVKKFLSNPLAFKIDRSKQQVYLSSILQPASFGSEFISKYGTDKKFKDQEPAVRAVLSFLSNYISEQDKDFLEVENYTIEYMRYNWRLNDSSER
jgi:hypothetical protein